MNTTRQNRKSQGLCIECGLEPIVPGKTRCVSCAEKNRRYARERWATLDTEAKKKLNAGPNITHLNRKVNSLCRSCGIDVATEGTRCISFSAEEATNARARRRTSEGKKAASAAASKWAKKHPGAVKEMQRRSQQKLRLEILSHYGKDSKPICVCCGEEEFLFLPLDHINGNGNRGEERKRNRL